MLLPVTVLLLAAPAPLSPVPGGSAWEQELLGRWREHSSEVAQTERDFRGAIEGGGLAELGRLSFVFREAGVRRWRRRRPNTEDREFAHRAALGQLPADFERNLPAIVGYLRLSLALEDAAAAVRRWPLSKDAPDLAAIRTLAGEMEAFRARARLAVKEGHLQPAYVLTRESAGRLADPARAAQLAQFRRQRIRLFWRGELFSLLWLLPLLLASGLGTALLIRRRSRQAFSRMGLSGKPANP